MQTLELSNLVTDYPEISRYTRVADNVGMVPPISEELAEQCILKLGEDKDIVGIKAHGAVSRGSTLYDAYEHTERLEHICKIVLVGRTV
jgi:L-fuculose-phosphate aldolase